MFASLTKFPSFLIRKKNIRFEFRTVLLTNEKAGCELLSNDYTLSGRNFSKMRGGGMREREGGKTTPTRKAWMILAESQEAFVHVLGTRCEDTRSRCLWRWSASDLLFLLLLRGNRSEQVSGNHVRSVLANSGLRIVFQRGFTLKHRSFVA